MTKKILTTAMLTALFLNSCKETPKQESSETIKTETIEKSSSEKIDKLTDKNGNVLETISFNEEKNTLKLKLNDEIIELTGVPSGSGSKFKNDHFEYNLWHGKTKIEKDGKVIFEAGEETMPK